MIDKYLSTFITVAKCKNFTKAAKELKMTQAGVSRQIMALEQSIGKELLIRNPRNVLLTQEGEELFNKGGEFLAWYQESFLKQKSVHLIRCATYQVFGEYWLSHFLKNNLLKSKIKFNLELSYLTHGQLLKKLNLGKLDFIVSREKINRSDISSFKLLEEEIFLVSKKKLDISLISQSNWIVYSENDFLLKKFSKTSGQIIKVNSYKSLVEFLELDNFIACVPKFVLDEFGLKNFQTRKKLADLSGPLYVSTLGHSKPNPVLKQLLDQLRSISK